MQAVCLSPYQLAFLHNTQLLPNICRIMICQPLEGANIKNLALTVWHQYRTACGLPDCTSLKDRHCAKGTGGSGYTT